MITTLIIVVWFLSVGLSLYLFNKEVGDIRLGDLILLTLSGPVGTLATFSVCLGNPVIYKSKDRK